MRERASRRWRSTHSASRLQVTAWLASWSWGDLFASLPSLWACAHVVCSAWAAVPCPWPATQSERSRRRRLQTRPRCSRIRHCQNEGTQRSPPVVAPCAPCVAASLATRPAPHTPGAQVPQRAHLQRGAGSMLVWQPRTHWRTTKATGCGWTDGAARRCVECLAVPPLTTTQVGGAARLMLALSALLAWPRACQVEWMWQCCRQRPRSPAPCMCEP